MNLEKIAEEKIEEAIANGLFDNLVGKGQPLDLGDYFATPEHLRSSHSMLKTNGFVPPEVELMKEIYLLEQELHTADDRRSKVIERQLMYKRTDLAMAMDRIRHQIRNNRSL